MLFRSAGTGMAAGRVGEFYDKGKAALVYIQAGVTGPDGNPLWSTRAGLSIGGEGGWGADRRPANDRERIGTSTSRERALISVAAPPLKKTPSPTKPLEYLVAMEFR